MISSYTKRLHLRNVSQNDVDEMFDYRNNEISYTECENATEGDFVE